MKINTFLGLVLFFFAATQLNSQVTVVESSNPAVMIDDDAYDGSIGSMTCDIINISGIGAVSDASVDINMSHTWVGDLAIKLVAPGGEVMGLMSRPGSAETGDDGSTIGGFGDSSNLEDTNTENWADGNPTSAEDMGSTLPFTDDVVCADDMLCDYFPFPDAIGGPASLAAFAGTVADGSGDWMLCIGDSAGGDLGELTSWTLTVTGEAAAMMEVVPTLGEWAIISLALILVILAVVAMNTQQSTVQLERVKSE